MRLWKRIAARVRQIVESTGLKFGQEHLRSVALLATPLVLGVVALMLAADWYVDPKTPAQRTNILTLCAQIAGGMLLLMGLSYTAKNFRLNREGQITERFTRAIDQLGSDEDAICLGGIYALERIARDSPTDRNHIYDIFGSFLRLRAMRPAISQAEEDFHADNFNPDDDYGIQYVPGGEGPSVVVQAVISVLGRRHTYDLSPRRQLNLRSVNLQSVDLSGLWLESMLLNYADFRKALFDQTRIVGCDLERANFERTDISKLRIEDSLIRHTNFSNVECYFGDLSNITFDSCDFREATINSTNLAWTRYIVCILHDADLGGCNLSDAKLINTVPYRVNLTSAVLDRCQLYGADLRTVEGLTAEQLKSAETGPGAKFPDYLSPVEPQGA